MRRITQASGIHHVRMRYLLPRSGASFALRLARCARGPAPRFGGLVCLVLLFCLAGEAPGPALALADSPPVDTAAYDTFADLAERFAQQQPQTLEDAVLAMMDTPPYAVWLTTSPRGKFSPSIMYRAMSYAFTPPDLVPADEGRQPRKPKRLLLLENLNYIHDRADSARAFLDEFVQQQAMQRVMGLLDGFISPGQLPDSLAVHFLAATPEIRFYEGRILVDVGLAIAAGQDNLARLIASTIYRHLAVPQSPAPVKADTGAEALHATFERLMYEGVAGWLESYDRLEFDKSHPLLKKVHKNRVVPLAEAGQTVEKMDRELGPLLEDAGKLDEDGARIDTLLRITSGYLPIGSAMAVLIATVHGEQRLRDCAHSPGSFLRSYQQAALHVRDTPLDTEDRLHDQFLNRMPPFFAPDFKKLLAYFPES